MQGAARPAGRSACLVRPERPSRPPAHLGVAQSQWAAVHSGVTAEIGRFDPGAVARLPLCLYDPAPCDGDLQRCGELQEPREDGLLGTPGMACMVVFFLDSNPQPGEEGLDFWLLCGSRQEKCSYNMLFR
jgi:hypothetical protein